MFSLNITNTDGAAFRNAIDGERDVYAERNEIVRVLKNIAFALEHGFDHGPCMDINGNRVGTWEMRED